MRLCPLLPLLLVACTPPDEPGEPVDDVDTATPADTATDTGPLWADGTHDCVDERYRAFDVRGWEVCVDQGVLEDEAHGEAVLTLLSSDLKTVLTVVPEGPAAFLQEVRVWVEHTSDWPGAVYHPSASWLSSNGYPTYWAESIQIANSANYLSWTAIQPAIVLHELSHAWHHQYLGYDDPDLLKAYDEAMASGIYNDVAYAGGGTGTAYATTNVQEYFAELTEAWFWENDYYPFVQEELVAFDPFGAEVIEASWAH